MPYTNRDLLRGDRGRGRDDLFVITERPEETADEVLVRVDLDAVAAVLDHRAGSYPEQPTVSDVRAGSGERWLLSGGTLITDQQGRIAVGLRGGDTADRFQLTNIGAGRCDQKLEPHCYEEMNTEFVLCVKEEGAWYQASFGPNTRLLHTLNQSAMRNVIRPIVKSIYESGGMLPLERSPAGLIETRLPNRITVEWHDRGTREEEKLTGYVFADHESHTTEFRLAVGVDLSAYEQEQIFFGEGTAYAEWLPLEAIRNLVKAEKVAGRRFVTRFLSRL